ncbi:BREX system P-loop protein BrxC [Clostridium sp. 001]|uniref:BREX system P-loop protein BrxC n=1 Tax=Clostridium sp. 001 TaxID=1970093 RepID=UPI001C2BEC0C|nr:BREX system P-loop protein BrxC [Clostridium sp. 001]QXE17805.1 hypothetical protein B5S50_02500 [Clostridium sp. 001]
MEMLKNIFDSDVMDKTINPVIKVNDNKDVIAEIQEYVVTNEIEEHYKRFFDAYFNNSAPDTCVWISGFFGSGKSHFMKILGYLLQNQNYHGIDVVKTIANKIKNNAFLAADLKNKLTKQNNKVILFSMTDVSSRDKSLLESIYSQIMIAFGYSEDIELANYELTMTLEGKYDDFKRMALELQGEKWEKFRDIKFNDRNKVLSLVIPKLYPEVYKNGFTLSDVFMNLNITADKIAKLIKQLMILHSEYDNIIVMIDEMGQYIGNDEEKMIYLQGTAESIEKIGKELGRKKIWLVVTAQQKLQDMIEDFDVNSKIKFNRLSHRFSTRLDLRSEDIDRVIKDRVLRKKDSYKLQLEKYYNDNGGAIAANLKIENSRNMYIGSENVFIESYPFLNYHFYISRDLLQEMMGLDKKEVNYGERNMIRLTQNVLKNSMKEMPFGTFVTLDYIFDAVKQDIENEVRLDIEKKIPDVFEGYDNKELYIKVAKALFVLDRVKYIGNNIKNIATCLTNNPLSPLDGGEVKKVLNDLINKGFVGKINEDGYKLLSVKEKKFEEKVRDVSIRKSDVERKRREIIEELLKDTKSGIRYEGSKFDINIKIDGEEKSKGGFINLEVYTSEEGQILFAMENNEKVIKWYSIDQIEVTNMIIRMMKLDKAIDGIRKDNSEEAIAIKREKQIEFDGLKKDIPNKIEYSLLNGKIVYCGSDYRPKDYGNAAKNIMEKFIIEESIPKVFNKFEDGAVNIQPADYKKYIQDVVLIDRPKGSYPDLCELGVMEDKTIKLGGAVYDALYSYIVNKNKWKEAVIGSSIIEDYSKPPYGWAPNIIKLTVAAMLRVGKIEIKSDGIRYDNYSQSKVKEIFLKDSLFNNITILPIVEADATARILAKNRLSTIFGKYAIDTVEDLAKKIKEVCLEEISKITTIKDQVKHIEFSQEVINKLTEKSRIYEKIEIAGDNQKINDFVKITEEEIQEMFRIVKLSLKFVNTKIDEYKEVKIQLNSIKRFSLYFRGDEKLDFESKINSITGSITSNSFIDNWQNIYSQYLNLKSNVDALYINKHNECNDIYKKTIENIKTKYAEHKDIISNETMEEFIRPLSNKLCVTIDKCENYKCEECKRDIQSLDNDIEILETLKSGITAKIDNFINPQQEAVNPPVKHLVKTTKNEVSIKQLIFDTNKKVIKNENDIDEYIEEIRLKMQKQIQQGKEIFIR